MAPYDGSGNSPPPLGQGVFFAKRKVLHMRARRIAFGLRPNRTCKQILGSATLTHVKPRDAAPQRVHRLGLDRRVMGALVAIGAGADSAIDTDLSHAGFGH